MCMTGRASPSVFRVDAEIWLEVGANPHAWLSYMSLLFHSRTMPSSDPVTVYLQT